MPIYEYVCTICQHEEEMIKKFTDPKVVECPKCKLITLSRIVSPASFKLKGGGWYETDSKNKSKPVKDEKKSDKSETNTKTESKTKASDKTSDKKVKNND